MKKTKLTALSILLTLAVALSIFLPLQAFGDNGSTQIAMTAAEEELRAEIVGEQAKYDEIYLHCDNLVKISKNGSLLSQGNKVLGKITIVNHSGNEYTVEEVRVGTPDISGMKRVFTEGAQKSKVKVTQAADKSGDEWYNINYKYYSQNEGFSDEKILEYLYGVYGQEYQLLPTSGGNAKETSSVMISQAKDWFFKKGFMLSFDLANYPINEKATTIAPGTTLQDYLGNGVNGQKTLQKVVNSTIESGTTSFDYGFAVHADNCNKTFTDVDVTVPITVKLKKVVKEEPTVKVTVENLDEKGLPLKGGKFTVTALDGGTVAPAGKQAADENGKAEFTLEKEKSYKLETLAPNGYDPIGEITFGVNKLGEITDLNGGGKGSAKVAGEQKNTLQIANALTSKPPTPKPPTPVTTTVTLQSVDESLTNLPGAKLLVTALDNGSLNPVATQTTGMNGTVEFTLENEKSYRLQVTSPSGYNAVDNIEFTVDENGEISNLRGAGKGDALIDNLNKQLLKIVFVKTPPNTKNITVQNTDKNNRPLPNTTLAVTALDGGVVNPAGTVILGTESKTEFTLEAQKRYKLTATSPSGYDPVGEITFTVDKSGNITNLSGNGSAAIDNKDNSVLNVAHTKTPPKTAAITIKKVDETGKPLAGAGFVVTGVSKQSSAEQVTTASGALEYTLEVSQTYTLKQTKMPSGYEKVGDISFTVNENGEITAVTGAGKGNTKVDTADKRVLQIIGEKIKQQEPKTVKVTIEVVNDQRKGLTGVGIMLFSLDGGQIDLSGEQKVPANGKVVYTLEKNKKYELMGTTIPEGCERISNILFQVNADGEVVVLSGEAQVGSSDRSVLTIVRAYSGAGSSGTSGSTNSGGSQREDTDESGSDYSGETVIKGIRTGDNTPIFILSLLLGVSAVVAGAFIYKRRRQK